MSEPLGVSIIVVNYNNEPFLAPAIDSALGQSHPLSEVIVVDDCSTNNSRAVIARMGTGSNACSAKRTWVKSQRRTVPGRLRAIPF